MRAYRRVLLRFVLGLLVAGCGVASAGRSTAFVSLVAVRTGSAWQTSAPVLATSDAVRIQQLYAALRALKPFPPGIFHCPADAGDLYHLTFVRGDGTSLAATAKPDGCADVVIGSGPPGPPGQIVDSAAFWSQFAATFHVPLRDVTPCGC